MKRTASTYLFAWLLLLAGCGRMEVGARPPRPIAAPTEKIAGSVVLDVSDVPQAAYCAYSEGEGELCVSDLRVAYEYGLKNIGEGFFQGDGPRYTVSFRMTELSHTPRALTSPGQPAGSRVAMQWQFVIKDNRGKVLSAASKTTYSPRVIYRREDADPAVAGLIDATLADVVAILEQFGKDH